MGLHRTETLRQDVELRRRLWGICVISDRWYCHCAIGSIAVDAYRVPFLQDQPDIRTSVYD